MGYMYIHQELPLQVGISPLSNNRGKCIIFLSVVCLAEFIPFYSRVSHEGIWKKKGV